MDKPPIHGGAHWEIATQAIERALILLRSVQTLEPTDVDGLEALLELAAKNLKSV